MFLFNISILRCLRLVFYQMTSGLLCLQEIRTGERERDRQTVETDEIKETDTDRGVRAAVLLLMIAVLVVAQAAEEGQDHLREEDHPGATREDGARVDHLPAIESVILLREIETLVEEDRLLARVADFRKNASRSQLIIQKISTCAR